MRTISVKPVVDQPGSTGRTGWLVEDGGKALWFGTEASALQYARELVFGDGGGTIILDRQPPDPRLLYSPSRTSSGRRI